LLVRWRQHLEIGDHSIGFRTVAGVSRDRLVQVRCPPVMQEE